MQEYINKPVLVAGVSAGGYGGARVVETLIPIVSELGLKYIAYPLYFSKVEETFKLSEEELNNKYLDKVNKSVEELIKAI
jgi:NAD(P)H-dependent FMN reductase